MNPTDAGSQDRRMTRRSSLVRLAGLGAAALGGSLWEGSPADAAGAGPAGVASGALSCVLTPELTEGPYYLPNEKVRRDITEGKPGTPLRLEATVVSASSCKPIRSAAVDVWHCDAGGVYSGFGGASSGGPPGGGRQSSTNQQTFLRGIQRTDARGLALFDTIYPGWYPGRAVHIHVKVHIAGNVVHTGQLFFPDSVTDAVYRRAPYSSRPGRDTLDATDSIYRNGGSKSVLALRKTGAGGYVGSVTMGVHTS